MRKYELQDQIIYGPVASRRLGASLGINLMPTRYKLCSMNCCYCQYGWTTGLVRDGASNPDLPDVSAVLAELQTALLGGRKIDYITFSGNGEPTLHPAFPEIVRAVSEQRDLLSRETGIALMSNATFGLSPRYLQAIEQCDLVIMKLDAGTEGSFRRVNHPAPGITLQSTIDRIKRLNHYAIQTMFIAGSVDNSTDAEVDAWIARLQELNPEFVQIYSLDREPASARIRAVSRDRLTEIAQRVTQVAGYPTEVV